MKALISTREATARWAKLRGPLDSLSTQVADVEPVLGRRIVRKWLKEAGMSPDFETVEQLLKIQTPTKISVGGQSSGIDLWVLVGHQ